MTIKDYARIEILTDDWVANQCGDVIKVEHETDIDIYYIDGWGRWSYVSKVEENLTYRYIPKGQRVNMGRGKYAV